VRFKILYIILIFFLISGYNGCVPDQAVKSVDIYRGTNSIVMNFLGGAPPDEVLENAEFQIIANIKNIGASDVRQGYLTVNLEKDYMNLDDWVFDDPIVGYGIDYEQVIFDLEGKSEFNRYGGEGIINVRAKTKKIEELIEKHKSTVGLTACYEYSTKANPTVCIDPDVYDLKEGDKACHIADVSLGSQGAPVAVTRVEQNMVVHNNRVEPQFLIYMANKGNGQIFDKQKIEEACSAIGLEGDEWNRINIEAELSGNELACNPNPIKLTQTKNFVRCSAPEQYWIDKDLLAYETILSINLTYGYTTTISKDVTIEKQ